MITQAEKGKLFAGLHQEPGVFVIPNAWDAGSARLIESLGAKAIATTSAGVAWSHGYPDGNRLPVRRLVATVADIVRVVRAPLTVDVEGGYSDDPAAVADTVAGLIDVGIVGINIEDGDQDSGLLCEKIQAVKHASARLGVDLFINARTDVYLRGLAPDNERVEKTLERAARYRDAGADGLFVPGLVDPAAISTIASQAGLPLNVIARGHLPAAAELERLGVRRLSAGPDLAESMYALTSRLTQGFLRDGDSKPLEADAMPYPQINALFY